MSQSRRYQALDGVRAGAIILVLIEHMKFSAGMPDYPQWWWHVGDLGNLGVRIFFVLSGFIITHLLLRESDQKGYISLRAFYVRRIFRIIPPLLAFMGIVGLGMMSGYMQVPIRQYLMVLVFLGNYVGDPRAWTLGHLWTLAVEEQFYLVWPAIVAFTIRLSTLRLLFIGLSLVLAPIMRVVGAIPTGFIENSDALAMGSLAAMAYMSPSLSWILRLLEKIPVMISGVMLIILNCEPVPPMVKAIICYPLIHLCVTAVIIRVIRVEKDPGTRILSTKPFVFVGVISYSLYLFQQPVLNRPPLEALPQFPWSIMVAFALAIASHYWIERPTMKLRDRFLKYFNQDLASGADKCKGSAHT
jgi:peptidoglycan/LPS O-acetylase OafA/YrhL